MGEQEILDIQVNSLNTGMQVLQIIPFVLQILSNVYSQNKYAEGVKSIPKDFDNELQIDVKLFTVLYADDTVLMSEFAEELQSDFNYFYEYCKKK